MLKWNLLNVFRLLFVTALVGVLFISIIYAAPASAATQANQAAADAPRFREYMGVRLGMPEAQVLAAFGYPSSSTDTQSRFLKSDSESVTVHYDAARRVRAITAM